MYFIDFFGHLARGLSNPEEIVQNGVIRRLRNGIGSLPDSEDSRGVMTVMERDDNLLGELTAKQRDVLDLLIQHKTSKEISRILGISPHTVDQRIMLARAKLNVASRNEVAQAYRRLIEIYGQPVYEESHVAEPVFRWQPGRQEDMVAVAGGPEGSGSSRQTGALTQPYYHVLPEMFDGPYGTLMRLGYIVAITVFLIVAVLGGLSMYSELAAIVDR